MAVKATIKVKSYANSDGHFDGQNELHTHSVHQHIYRKDQECRSQKR